MFARGTLMFACVTVFRVEIFMPAVCFISFKTVSVLHGGSAVFQPLNNFFYLLAILKVVIVASHSNIILFC